MDEVFDRLTKRVGDMSGLNMETSEIWQAQNYGIGGHYDGDMENFVHFPVIIISISSKLITTL